MTRKLSMALAIGAALAASLCTTDAQARFRRSHGSSGSNGGYYSNGSGGSFGGLFSRRSHNGGGDCNSCNTESYSSCGCNGGTTYGEPQGTYQESHDHGDTQVSPPPAPSDPGTANPNRAGQGAAVPAPAPAIAADRKPTVMLTSNRRLSRILR
jgi:hypothetical protein